MCQVCQHRCDGGPIKNNLSYPDITNLLVFWYEKLSTYIFVPGPILSQSKILPNNPLLFFFLTEILQTVGESFVLLSMLLRPKTLYGKHMAIIIDHRHNLTLSNPLSKWPQ